MTSGEIKEKLEAIFDDADDVVVSVTENVICFTIQAMYEVPGRSLTKLLEVSQLLGTTEIEEYATINSPGCDTCDYGSQYGVTLYAPNVIGATQ